MDNQPIVPLASPKQVRQRSSQACQACRISRRKCEGGQPCAACLRKNVPCIYLPKDIQKRRGPKGKKDKLTHIQRENQELRVQLQKLSHSTGMVGPDQVGQVVLPSASGLPQFSPSPADIFAMNSFPISQNISSNLHGIASTAEQVGGQAAIAHLRHKVNPASSSTHHAGTLERTAHHTNRTAPISSLVSEMVPVHGFDRLKMEGIVSPVEHGYLRAYFAMVNPLYPAVDDDTFWDTLTNVRAQQQATQGATAQSTTEGMLRALGGILETDQRVDSTVCEKCNKAFCPCPTLPPQSLNTAEVVDLEGFLILLELLCCTGAKILGQVAMAKEYFRIATTLMKRSQSKYFEHRHISDTEPIGDAIIAMSCSKFRSSSLSHGMDNGSYTSSPNGPKDEKPSESKRCVLVYTGPTSIHRISYHLLICIFGQAMGHRIEDAEKNSRDAIVLYNRLTEPLPAKLQSTFLLLSASMRQLVKGHLSLQVPEESTGKNSATRLGFIIGTCLHELQENFPSLDFGDDDSSPESALTLVDFTTTNLHGAANLSMAGDSTPGALSTHIGSTATVPTTNNGETSGRSGGASAPALKQPGSYNQWTPMSFLDLSPTFGAQEVPLSLESVAHLPPLLSSFGLFESTHADASNNNTATVPSATPAAASSLPSLFPKDGAGTPLAASQDSHQPRHASGGNALGTVVSTQGATPSRQSSRGSGTGQRMIPIQEFIRLLDEAVRLQEENPSLMPSFPLKAAMTGMKALAYARASADHQEEMVDAIRTCLTLTEKHPLARTSLGLSLVIARLIPILKAVIETENTKANTQTSTVVFSAASAGAASAAHIEGLRNLLLRASQFVQSSAYGQAALLIALKAGPGGLRARYRAKRRLSSGTVSPHASSSHTSVATSVATSGSGTPVVAEQLAPTHLNHQPLHSTQAHSVPSGSTTLAASAAIGVPPMARVDTDTLVTEMAQSLSDTNLSVDHPVTLPSKNPSQLHTNTHAASQDNRYPQSGSTNDGTTNQFRDRNCAVPLQRDDSLPNLFGPTALLPLPEDMRDTPEAEPAHPHTLRIRLKPHKDTLLSTSLDREHPYPTHKVSQLERDARNSSILTPAAMAKPVVHGDLTPLFSTLSSFQDAHSSQQPVPPLGFAVPDILMNTPRKELPISAEQSPKALSPATASLNVRDITGPPFDMDLFDFDLQFKLPSSFPVPEVGGRPEVDEFSLIPLSLFRTSSTNSV